MARDYYRLLQVDPSADAAVVEAAYRRLARKYHPDLNPDREAGVVMRQLNEAYAVLRDPVRRAAYDRDRERAARRAARTSGAPRVRPAPAGAQAASAPSRPAREEPWRAEAPQAAARPASWIRVRARIQALLAALRANRAIVLSALGALALATAMAAIAASFFAPADLVANSAAPAPSVVVVSHSPIPEATHIARTRGVETPAAWPPFPFDTASAIDGRAVPPTIAAAPAPALDQAGGDAGAGFLSRAAHAVERRILGPRPPAPPSTPVPPG